MLRALVSTVSEVFEEDVKEIFFWGGQLLCFCLFFFVFLGVLMMFFVYFLFFLGVFYDSFDASLGCD